LPPSDQCAVPFSPCLALRVVPSFGTAQYGSFLSPKGFVYYFVFTLYLGCAVPKSSGSWQPLTLQSSLLHEYDNFHFSKALASSGRPHSHLSPLSPPCFVIVLPFPLYDLKSLLLGGFSVFSLLLFTDFFPPFRTFYTFPSFSSV